MPRRVRRQRRQAPQRPLVLRAHQWWRQPHLPSSVPSGRASTQAARLRADRDPTLPSRSRQRSSRADALPHPKPCGPPPSRRLGTPGARRPASFPSIHVPRRVFMSRARALLAPSDVTPRLPLDYEDLHRTQGDEATRKAKGDLQLAVRHNSTNRNARNPGVGKYMVRSIRH